MSSYLIYNSEPITKFLLFVRVHKPISIQASLLSLTLLGKMGQGPGMLVLGGHIQGQENWELSAR